MTDEYREERRLNDNGVKDSCDMWRTVKGERYVQWLIWASNERVAAYRERGIRVRRFAGEVFIHHADQAKGQALEAELGDEVV
jgi:hypothetical protein